MDTPPQDTPGERSSAGSLRGRIERWIKSSTKLHTVVIVVLAVAVVGFAGARIVAERQAEEQRIALQEHFQAALAEQASSLLRMSALPLAWAVRSALLKDDLTSIEGYLQRMMQEKHVTGAVLLGGDDKIRLASNGKLNGRSAQETFPEIALGQQSPAVVTTDKEVRVVVPVMGYDRRLGTLILSYSRSGVDPAGSGPAQGR